MTPRPDIPTPAADALAKLDVVPLHQWRGVRLTERAIAGDVDAAIAWLQKYGGSLHWAG